MTPFREQNIYVSTNFLDILLCKNDRKSVLSVLCFYEQEIDIHHFVYIFYIESLCFPE